MRPNDEQTVQTGAAILAAYDAGDERVRAALYSLAVGGKGKVAA